MRKTKLMLVMLTVPLMLAGCGNNDGQFSGHSNTVSKVVNKSKQSAQAQSEKNSNSFPTNDYQRINQSIIKNALDKKQISTARAQIASRKLLISGTVKFIGKPKHDQKAIVLSNQDQSYLVYGNPYVLKDTRVGKQINVYGNGLSVMSSKASSFGLQSTDVPENTLLFNAIQINSK
ncbi:hypothetical protein MOO44_00150 (plasmid) [Nicoliella spurrieriana]|uniref:Lipoprotein n=1 Tax=Nicoliella spurrieriana TaxID=2925830 RepID=A0A976RQP1_9LACO|nr:hypothetical protein [Nicoliella spurrieriana]UQS86090.1 hypothetical protein MOO44_00150 [Nicoliella spurrieriana]